MYVLVYRSAVLLLYNTHVLITSDMHMQGMIWGEPDEYDFDVERIRAKNSNFYGIWQQLLSLCTCG